MEKTEQRLLLKGGGNVSEKGYEGTFWTNALDLLNLDRGFWLHSCEYLL